MPITRTKSMFATYGDYLKLPGEERWELIEGVLYDMSPAPSKRHQQISVELTRQIATFLAGKECQMFHAPFDVRFPENDEADEDVASVVQPDIVVICDPSKLDERGCRGAPDFIVEILSPSTAAKDQIQKLDLYEKSGVTEYWIVHPADNTLTVRVLGADGNYGKPRIFEGKGKKHTSVLPDLEIDLDEVFKG